MTLNIKKSLKIPKV